MERFKQYSPFRYEGNLLRWTDFNLPIFGNVWFVDGDDGNDGSAGDSDEVAFKTIQAGIDAASARDTIYIKAMAPNTDASDPGEYVEDLSIPYAKYGLRLVGVGSGSSKMPYDGPKIKNATATTLLEVLAPGVHIEGLQFNCTRNSGTYGIYFDGGTEGNAYTVKAGSVGFKLINCMIKNGDDAYGVTVKGGYGGMISNCTFQFCTHGINLAGNILPHNGHTIEYCNFKSINNAAITVHISIPAGSSQDWNIDHCNFQVATKFITIGATGVSGVISNCCFADGSSTVVANSTGKIEIPAANDAIGVCGCYDGAGALIVAAGA